MNWPEVLRQSLEADRVFYSGLARRETRLDEFWPITDQELCESVYTAEAIETYPEDRPFPRVLIYGSTDANRPLHAVFAYDAADDRAVVVTVYQPDPAQWEDYRRRRR